MNLKRKIEWNFLLTIFLSLLLINLLIAQEAGEIGDVEFSKKFNSFKETGKVSEYSEDISKFTTEQKESFVQAIAEMGEEATKTFWKEWNSIDKNVKTEFVGKLGADRKGFFLEEYGKQFSANGEAITIEGDNIKFGGKGVIGTKEGYVDLNLVKKFNERGGKKDPITTIKHETIGDKEVLTFETKNGRFAKISVKQGGLGYYPMTKSNGEIEFVPLKKKEDTVTLDKESQKAIKWNKFGSVTIDHDGDNPRITLDFKRDEKGESVPRDWAKINFKSGEEYSVMRKKAGEKDGKQLYERDVAEITLDDKGRPTKLSDTFRKAEDFGGFFGKDTNIFHSEEDLAKIDHDKQGNFFLIDKEKGFVKSGIKKLELQSNNEETAKKISDFVVDNKIKLSGMYSAIKVASVADLLPGTNLVEGKIESKIAETLESFGLDRENIVSKALVSVVSSSILSKPFDGHGEGFEELKGKTIFTEGFKKLKGKTILDAAMDYASNHFTVAENLAIGTTAALRLADKTKIVTPLAEEGSFVRAHVNPVGIKNIDFRDGSLDFYNRDSRGRMTGKTTNIISTATENSYNFNPNFNDGKPNFGRVNLLVENKNRPNEKIQLVTDNRGRLQTAGIGSFENLRKQGEIKFDFSADVKVMGKDYSESGNFFTFKFEADANSLEEYNKFLESDEVEVYNRELSGLQSGSVNAQQKTEIDNKFAEISMKANKIKTSRDYKYSLDIQQQGVADAINKQLKSAGKSLIRLSDSSASSVGTSKPINFNDPFLENQLERVLEIAYSDPAIVEQAAARELFSSEAYKEDGKNHIGREFGNYLAKNRVSMGSNTILQNDDKNKLVQTKLGSTQFTFDRLYAGVAKEIVPLLLTHGQKSESGAYKVANSNLNLNYEVKNGRFSGDSKKLLDATRRRHVGDGLLAQVIFRGKESVSRGIQKSIEREFSPRLQSLGKLYINSATYR